MLPVSLPGTERLSRILGRYARKATIARAAGLLTVPSFQANATRIEHLVHLAVLHCAGKERPDYRELSDWVNRHLGSTQAASLEDPPEDVFLANVETPFGNKRIFQGIWEGSDFYLQAVFDVIAHSRAPAPLRHTRAPVLALLSLSDAVASRARLHRWQIETSHAKGRVAIDHGTDIPGRAKAVTFSDADLAELGISRDELRPFILREEDVTRLPDEEVGDSSLERRPLVEFDDCLVLALPSAVSPALRRYVIEEVSTLGLVAEFSQASSLYSAAVTRDCLREFDNDAEVDVERGDLSGLPSFSDWVLSYDTNRFLHVLVLDDDLESIITEGFSGLQKFPEPVARALGQYIARIASQCTGRDDFGCGSTLVILGGLGRGFQFGSEEWPDNWGMGCIRLSDLVLLSSDSDDPVSRFLKCLRYRDETQAHGVTYFNVNGDFNYYSYLRQAEHRLLPADFPLDGGVMFLAHDHVLPTKVELRGLADQHVVPTTQGGAARVLRHSRHSYFESMDSRPVYVSLTHLRKGGLGGVVERGEGRAWLTISSSGTTVPRKLIYELWSGCLMLLDRIIDVLGGISSDIVEIRIKTDDVSGLDSLVGLEGVNQIPLPRVEILAPRRVAEIILPRDFLGLFQVPQNLGEHACASAIVTALLSLRDETPGSDQVGSVVKQVIPDSGERFLHLFHSPHAIDHVLAKEPEALLFIHELDMSIETLGLSAGCFPVGDVEVSGKEACNTFLHAIVDKLWGRIRARLRELRRTSVLRTVLLVHESVMRDRDQWRQTAQALVSLYRSEHDVVGIARSRESDRSRVSLAARTVIEMAVCECIEDGGRDVSREEIARLLSLVSLFIEVATDSDAIMSDMAPAHVRLYRSGEYELDRELRASITAPFMKAYFDEEFEGAVIDYPKLYDRKISTGGEQSRFSSDFSAAFQVEFGLTPDELVQGAAECLDLAVKQDCVVVETTLGELRDALTRNRGMAPETADAFIGTLGLRSRPAWEVPPLGFVSKDLHPWRFRRRMSATSRPLAVCGDADGSPVLYGAGALRLAIEYLLLRTEAGQLPGTFYASTEMRSYIGSAVDRNGHDFAKRIGDRLRSAGWSVRTELQMSELLAPKNEADGDIDVLAWRETGELLLLECKRLQMARTVAEIAETCRKFRGEAKDELGKHLRRANWVRQHPQSLQRIVGFVPVPALVDDRVVTNTHVPMRYLTDLPMDPSKIGPLSDDVLLAALD